MKKIVITADGSHSLYAPEWKESYHSTNGALQESLHVFIDAGFRHVLARRGAESTIRILEAGFGTGLNALLTLMEAEKVPVHVWYESVEKYPLPERVYAALNYAALTGSGHFAALHEAPWEQACAITEHFTLLKRAVDLLQYQPAGVVDLIYFDAFSPGVQPELWTEAIFRKLYGQLSEGGVLVTYSSKGTVKQALRAVGFCLERLPGAAGKRHIIRAVK
jgi:tRNA U34 5-methylaminomethyl-2-thiouridine-forming methyltransferase MnmC